MHDMDGEQKFGRYDSVHREHKSVDPKEVLKLDNGNPLQRVSSKASSITGMMKQFDVAMPMWSEWQYDATDGDYAVGQFDSWQTLHSDGDQLDTYVASFVVQRHTRCNGALRIWDWSSYYMNCGTKAKKNEKYRSKKDH